MHVWVKKEESLKSHTVYENKSNGITLRVVERSSPNYSASVSYQGRLPQKLFEECVKKGFCPLVDIDTKQDKLKKFIGFDALLVRIFNTTDKKKVREFLRVINKHGELEEIIDDLCRILKLRNKSEEKIRKTCFKLIKEGDIDKAIQKIIKEQKHNFHPYLNITLEIIEHLYKKLDEENSLVTPSQIVRLCKTIPEESPYYAKAQGVLTNLSSQSVTITKKDLIALFTAAKKMETTIKILKYENKKLKNADKKTPLLPLKFLGKFPPPDNPDKNDVSTQATVVTITRKDLIALLTVIKKMKVTIETLERENKKLKNAANRKYPQTR